MEIIIVLAFLTIFLVFKHVESLRQQIKDLNRENDHLLDSSTSLYYENKKVKEQVAKLKQELNSANNKVSEYEAKIKKITEFFGK